MIVKTDENLPKKCPYCGSADLIEEGRIDQPSCQLPPQRIICGCCSRTVWTRDEKSVPSASIRTFDSDPLSRSNTNMKLVNAIVFEATVTAPDKEPKTVKKTIKTGDCELNLSSEEYPLCLLGKVIVNGKTLSVLDQSFDIYEGCFLALEGKHSSVYREMLPEKISVRIYPTYLC